MEKEFNLGSYFKKQYLEEIEFRPNTGLAQIKDQGEVDGADAITKELRQYNLKNVPDMDAYADGFVKGAANKAMFYKDKLDQAIRGGGDEESLMGLVGLKEDLGGDISIEPAMENMLSSAIDIFEAATDLDGFGEEFDEEDILEMITLKIRQAIGPRMG